MISKLADLTDRLELSEKGKSSQMLQNDLKQTNEELKRKLTDYEQTLLQLQEKHDAQINELMELNQDLLERLQSAKDNKTYSSSQSDREEELKR